ncbi:Outer membrane protein TolC [Tenacibaculum sp. MAR_2010_89]|uniref:TolC family protein n=1 Tax=Tenacibaculum sp. MAR_2010_89 TaxID=1250198 RepID=UPI000895DE15|nr:TolC family protein [Tenacibaculum sp. MAR_2010_89]SED59658.1 Outer membrane protein TolC [Tenacibaculum sp. MAR_2010_89]
MKTKNILSILFILMFSGFSYAQELQSLIDEALANNPKIKQFELQYKRVSEKVNEVNTLPNTNIAIGYFVSEPETRTGAQRFKVSINQMLPWFGTISSREDYVSSLADAKFEDITIAKRQLIASISTSFYNLYAIKAKQQVLTENINLLKTYETMALTSVEVGKASAVDVLRLQMRQNDLNQSKAILQQQFLAEQTAFNKLLNRDKNTAINVVSELEIPLNDSTINTDSLQFHPELIKYDKFYQSVEKSELLNQKESSPMIGFGLDYVNVTQRPDMNFNDNGKDIVMPMVSFSIPIFNKKYKSKTKQNEIQQEEFNSQKQERFNRLETLLDKAIKERTSARIRKNTQSKNLKQAKNAETILVKSYETGTIDFNDVLDIQELQLKFQLNQIKAVQNYYVQSTIINYLIQ